MDVTDDEIETHVSNEDHWKEHDPKYLDIGNMKKDHIHLFLYI